MNSLIFNPQNLLVPQWKHIYMRQTQISQFQTILDRICSYLTSIRLKTIRKPSTATSPLSPRSPLKPYSPQNRFPPPSYNQTSVSASHNSLQQYSIWIEGETQKKIEQIHEMREKFKSDYKQSIAPQVQKSLQIPTTHATYKHITLKGVRPKIMNKFQICQAHLFSLRNFTVELYDNFLDEESKLVSEFISYKLQTLKIKFNKVTYFLQNSTNISKQSSLFSNIRTLFDNLFIEVHYLRSLVSKSLGTLDEHTEHDFTADDSALLVIRQKSEKRLRIWLQNIQDLKSGLRSLYLMNYCANKSRLLSKNPQKVENMLIKQIGVNSDEYKDITNESAWGNGFISAVLLFALCAIIIFRQLQIKELESLTDYRMEFQVWRGACYLIVFNWVCAIAFYLMTRLKINYKLIMLEDSYIVGKHQSFLRTACLLTTIYLILFLVYLLHALKYIEGHDGLSNLGYVMWIVNIVFLLNPFKVLNYQSRVYYLCLLKKFLMSPFYPMNVRILFFTLMIGSFAQPFNDFAFTICTLQGIDLSTCQWRARLVTFIYLILYFTIRGIQSFRLHHQFFQGICFSPPRMRFVAVIFSIITIIASFLYAIYLTQEMLIFWIVVGSLATIARTNSEIRADWGLISFDEEDCLLRKDKELKNIIYYIAMIADPIFDIAWVLTISNNVQAPLKIDILYFFLLLSCIEFIRRGMWMFFFIEDLHSKNVGNFRALADDSLIMEQVQKHFGRSQPLTQSQSILREVEPPHALRPEVGLQILINPVPGVSEFSQSIPELSLQQLKAKTRDKVKSTTRINEMLQVLDKHLNFLSRTYEKISEQPI